MEKEEFEKSIHKYIKENLKIETRFYNGAWISDNSKFDIVLVLKEEIISSIEINLDN